MRLKLRELTPVRLFQAGKRRFYDIPDKILWRFSQRASENKKLLNGFYNKHKNERCFIIANGPSLSEMELSPLKSEYTIGMNRAYLLFEQWGFSPNYYSCINELVLEQFADDIAELEIPKFLNWNRRRYFPHSCESLMFLKFGFALNDYFSEDITCSLASGGTVTFASLQLAYYMGFSKVIIIGMDHNFCEKGIPNKTELRTDEVDRSHCHPNYFPKGVKWQLPDLLRSELAYIQARTVYESTGRKVLDATVNGKCDIFEKIDFASLF